MAKIYTKVGDRGATSLLGGQKVPKSDARLEAYGTVDELSAVLGWVRASLFCEARASTFCEARASTSTDTAAHAPQSSGADAAAFFARLDADLETIQHWLFDLGSLLAAAGPEDREKFKLAAFELSRVTWLESRIDAASAVMPPLRGFVLPAGSEIASRFHVARVVARRAERKLVALGGGNSENTMPEGAIPFLNRLGDYLFTMARYANHRIGVADTPWKKAETPA